MIRTVYVVIIAITSTLFWGSIAFFTGLFFNPYSKVVDYCAYRWAKAILFSAGIKLDLSGIENIDPKRNYIIMANHQSQFDILVLYSILPVTSRFMAKKELFKVPFFGFILKATGMIKIDRSDREKAIQSINQAIDTIKKENVSIVIFPEGTRSLDGEIHDFKKGGFILAIKSGIPILPVSISGSKHISQKNSKKISSGRIKVIIGKPIDIKGFSFNRREELIHYTKNVIVNDFVKDYQ